MKLSFRVCAVIFVLAITAIFFGCADNPAANNSGSGGSTGTVGVQVQGNTSRALDIGQTTTITVTTTNDSGAGVTWTCSGAACTAATNLSASTTTSVTFTATTAGSATITATSAKNSSVTESVTITVTAVPAITGATLAGGTVGVAYNQSITETGGAGTLAYSLSAGALPGGLQISATTGAISGTPTAAGTFPFTVKVTDQGSPTLSATAQFSITVQAAAVPLSITTASPLPAGSVNTPYSTTISASGGTAPYTFSIDASGTQLPAGLTIATNNNQAVIAGTPTASGSFTNIVVDVRDSATPTANTAHTAFALTIAAAPLVVTPGSGILPNASQNQSYSQTISATGGTPPYTFALDGSSANLPAGLNFTPTAASATIAGTPTALGTTTGIIVDVTDSASVTQKVTYSVTVTLPCGSGSESLINGQYAMLVKGFDSGTGTGETSPQPAYIGAVLYTDGAGHVDAGTLDMNLNGSHGIAESGVAGTYQIGSDHRGCMSLTTPSGTQNFRLSLAGINSGVASTIHMVDFDAAGPFTSGVMMLQDTTAFSETSVIGNYVFSVSSPQNSAVSSGKEAGVGVVTLGAGGTITGGELDINDAGQLDTSGAATWSTATSLPIASGGTYFVGTANGLGNLNFTVSLNGTPTLLTFQAYVVSANQLLLLPGGDQTQSGRLFGAGLALQQTTSALSNASLSATTVLHESAYQTNGSNPPTVSTLAGLLTGNGTGGLTLSAYLNNGSAIQAATGSDTVSVASNGRTVFGTGGGSTPPLLWLVTANEGFLLGGGTDVETGFFEPQTATTVSGSASSAFGTIDPELAGSTQETGVATFSGGNISATADLNAAGTLTPSSAIGPLSYSVDGTGLGSIPSGCTIGGTGPSGCAEIFYIVSPTKTVQMNLLNKLGSVTGSAIVIANQ